MSIISQLYPQKRSLVNLKRTDIEGDTMHITTVKTYDRLPINLNSLAQAMKPYIEIAEKTKADAMKLFDEGMKK